MSSSEVLQDKASHPHLFPQAVNDGSKKSRSGIVDEHNLSEIVSSSSDSNIPPPPISSPVSQTSLQPEGTSIGFDMKQTPSDEKTTSKIDHKPSPHHSETTCVFLDDLHMTNHASVVKSSNQNLSEQVPGISKRNGPMFPFKLPITSLKFGRNMISSNLPETLNHEEHENESSCIPDTLGRGTLISGVSLPMKLSPLLSSSIRLGGCFRLTDKSTRHLFTPEDQLEGCFSDQFVSVFVVTWNMLEMKDLPVSIEDLLLPLHLDVAADMYVIGTQESTPAKKEWELLLQRTLGPSFILVQTAILGTIYLSFFLRRDLIWFCSSVKDATFATRPVTITKTKGGVGLSFTLFGSSFLFINSHFTAYQHNVAERNSDMQRIALNLGVFEDGPPLKGSADMTATFKFDYVFWCGDLNYRVDLDRDTVNQRISDLNYMSLLLEDQLTKEILQGNVFRGFSEQPIAFPPTYKFDLETDIYDTSEKQRVPSWTDRILFKSRGGTGITGVGYYSFSALKCSDHKPVCAIFKVKLKPSSDMEGIPDTLASFNRNVYITANRQRKALTERLMRHEQQVISRSAESAACQSEHPHNRKERATSQICVLI